MRNKEERTDPDNDIELFLEMDALLVDLNTGIDELPRDQASTQRQHCHELRAISSDVEQGIEAAEDMEGEPWLTLESKLKSLNNAIDTLWVF